ncbi:MAG: Rrf2 family transcriptional regulator [Cytophagaceae bacterium]
MSYSLSFSKGILVVIFVSDKIRQGQYDYLSTASISEILNIPKPTLVKILQSLSSAGILETKEGKSGGVRLIKKPSQVTVLDVFNALEAGKPLFQTSFDINAKGKRPDKAQNLLQKMFKESETAMKNTLSQKSIEDLLEEMGK